MTVGDGNVDASHVPVVDLGEIRSDDDTSRLRVAQALTEACRKVGFVYIINHGVRQESVAEAFSWSKKFFDMSHAEKMLAPHPDGPKVHRGYSYPGLEKVSQLHGNEDDKDKQINSLRQTVDSKESYEIGSEENDDQPNVWPPKSLIPGFREFMDRFYWECSGASKEILHLLAIGLGLESEDFFDSYHSGHNNQLRLLHYPPVPAHELEQKIKTRIPAHTDWGSITMLFQDDCGGLQVEHPNNPGKFIDATPIEGALVMNVGDLLQRWTNDTLKSTLHRVDLPPLHDRITGPERITRARYSIPYFVSPDLYAVVSPVCVTEANPPRYEPIIQNEYRLMRASVQY